MRSRSPFEYDISVSADKKRRARARGLKGETASEARKCDWKGCTNPGEFRAPKSRDRLNEYRWFCASHIRDFNKNWNYYEGWSDEDFDKHMRQRSTWERPTWRLGDKPIRPDGAPGHSDGRAWERFGFQDPLEVLGSRATINSGAAAQKAERTARRLPRNEQSAIEILGVEATAAKADIRRQFRSLVKDLHPDMNGGQRSDEDRLRDVVWAWDQIKNSRNFT